MGQTKNNALFGGLVPSGIGTSGQALVVKSGLNGLEYATVSGSGGGGGAVSASANTSEFSQASNGYSVGNWIYVSGSSTALANATASTSSEPMLGVVTTAGDPTFTVTTEGEATLTSHGFEVGSVLYLSETAGEATVTASVEGVYKQLGFVKDANTIHVRIGDTIVLGGDSNWAFRDFTFTGDGSSVNFDTPVDIASREQVLIEINGKIQPVSAYSIVSDGDGNPRRIKFTEAPDLDVEINVRYLGVVKPVAEIIPTNSTDYNSGVPVTLATGSTTSPTNTVDSSSFYFSHGLSSTPKDVRVVLRCLSSDVSYSVNEEVDFSNLSTIDAGDYGPGGTVSCDSSKVYVNLNANADSYTLTNKDDFSDSPIDLSKWGVVVYANEEMAGTNGVISAVNTPATEFESSAVVLGTDATTFKTNTNFTFAHGLSQKPKSVRAVIQCVSAEKGYSIGDEVELLPYYTSATVDQIITISVDSTNIITLFDQTVSSTSFQILNKDTGDNSAIDLTKWAVKVYANSELGGYKGDRGPAGTGKIAQVKYTEDKAAHTFTGVIPADGTIPQNTEGDLLLTQTVTPKNPDSQLMIEVSLSGEDSSNNILAIFKDSETDAFYGGKWTSDHQTFKVVIPANGTNTRTYSVRTGKGSAGTYYVNTDASAITLGGILSSNITITEILP
jgi:hypothetical protein